LLFSRTPLYRSLSLYNSPSPKILLGQWSKKVC
jgi:hypothetical protein